MTLLVGSVTRADAADLYRLASSASGPLYPGCTVEVAITCDHSRFPTETPLDPNRALRALSFGLELPAPLQYAGYTFDGTYLKQQLGQNPDFAAVRGVTGGVTIGIVLDMELAQSLPEGLNQSIIKIRIGVPAGTPSQTIPLNIVGTLGSPVVARELVMPLGSVTPTVRNGRVTITSGTCAIAPFGGYRPAAVGLLQGAVEDSSAANLGDEEQPGYYTDSTWDISDPTSIPFEEPKDDELTEEWDQPVPKETPAVPAASDLEVEPKPDSGTSASLAAGAAGAAEECDYDARVSVTDPGEIVCDGPDAALEEGLNSFTASVGRPVPIDILRVAVALTHTNPVELSLTLTSPVGTEVALCTACDGGITAPGLMVIWSDDGLPLGSGGVNLGCRCRVAPIDTDGLADFAGESPEGEWTLEITDATTDPGDSGVLDVWCLQFDVSEHPTLDPGITACNDPEPDASIPDGTGAVLSSTIEVADSSTVASIDVFADVDHGDIDQLTLELTSPDATTVLLHDATVTFDLSPSDDATDNDIFLVWSDTGADPGDVFSECGCYVAPPTGSLADFVGDATAGTWTLTVEDGVAADTAGVLEEWCVYINAPRASRIVDASVPLATGLFYPTIGGALAGAIDDPAGIEAIHVRSGSAGTTYTENLVVAVDDFFGRLLWLYGEKAPDASGAAVDGSPAVSPDDEPCLVITGVGGVDSWIVVGALHEASPTDAEPPVLSGWRGLRLTGGEGSSDDELGGGIRIEGADVFPSPIAMITSITIVGNVIEKNGTGLDGLSSPVAGGGVSVLFAADVFIFQNEVRENEAYAAGGGVDVLDSCCLIAENWIHGNGFLEPDEVPAVTQLALGGGIRAESGNAILCRNRVYDNTARQGGGVYAFLFSTPFDFPDEPKLHVEGNFIYRNGPYNNEDVADECPLATLFAGFRGGGLHVRTSSVVGGVAKCAIEANHIFENDMFLPEGDDPCTDSDDVPSQVGGGVFMHLPLAISAGAPGDGRWPRYIANNVVYGNRARGRAGGIWLAPFAYVDESFPFYHNTVTNNNLEDEVDPRGTEVYMPYISTGFPALGYPYVDGVNNIVMETIADTTADEVDWFAECGATSGVMLPAAWRYTQMLDLEDVDDCGAGATGLSLFGDESDVQAAVIVDEDDPHYKDQSSPGVDSGFADLSDFGFIPLAQDIDGDVRPAPHPGYPEVEDRGADEFTDFVPEFRRGDIDGTGVVSPLIDALYILTWQFLGGPALPCLDAADVDDNNSVSALLDALYLLTWAFLGGPDPPMPGTTDCGIDSQPDADGLGCADESPCS